MSFRYELFLLGTFFLSLGVCDVTDLDPFPLRDLNIYQITNEVSYLLPIYLIPTNNCILFSTDYFIPFRKVCDNL